ncbi:hypothetical protein CROQUDRAFT_95885 [Cronartium quercuum f. sp. fusiforme G11]|uniref:Uncharacterized protein n=1 Tax=Cronartium quercuum f. sp. fusiforme G11 TaxID=708437 RepID=A0A9P6T924_9BASI|nr:hypothetical protein CROQUDRAFT_95885 [Cronartium quercuum f. sp. fusiforme G11]
MLGPLCSFGFGETKPKTTGFKLMSFKTLKKAMIKLSTHGVLTSLPSETVNYLAFNNATLS